MVRLAAILFTMLSCFGCSHQEAAAPDLSLIAQQPLKFDGVQFKGIVYVYLGEGYYAFYPRPVLTESEVNKFDVTFLPGEHAEALTSMKGLRSGDKLSIQGTLKPDRACFSGNTCAPWPHPVFIDDLQVSLVK